MDLAKNVMVTRCSAGMALLALLASIAACGPGRPQGNEEVPPQLTFDNLVFRVYRGSVLTAEGVAGRATFRRDNADVGAEQIDVRFPGVPSRPDARVLAVRGTGNLKERRFVASGGVRAEQAGEIAITDEARYSAEDGLIRGDRPIEVRGGAFTVRGPGFTFDPRDEVLNIEGGASMVAGEVQR